MSPNELKPEVYLSLVASAVQASGALLLGVTLLYLSRLFRRSDAALWAGGWGALFVALSSVFVFIRFGGRLSWVAYLVAEWGFLILLAAGCRERSTGQRFRPRPFLVAFLPALGLAVAFVPWLGTFNDLFSAQAIVGAGMFAFSFWQLQSLPLAERQGGWVLMRLALGGLTLFFAAYVPLYGGVFGDPRHLEFLGYAPFVDLLLETLLGFGMVLLVSDDARRATSDALSKLEDARGELERQARIDPLTEVFNRHVFHTLVGRRGREVAEAPAKGTVAMIDMDGLKQINDTIGHDAGDVAIRGAASAIRRHIRPEDLLFRWGGDEFLLLLPEVSLELARTRLQQLESGFPVGMPDGRWLTVSLSVGLAPFESPDAIARAAAAADQDMYARRAERRAEPSVGG